MNKLSSSSLQVRDRYMIRLAAGNSNPDRVLSAALVEALWVPLPQVGVKTAFLGISKAISKILDLIKKVPHFWDTLQKSLEIEGWEDMTLLDKTKALGSKLQELLAEGKKALGHALKEATHHFPLNLLFASKSKLPGLTHLIQRIIEKSPVIQTALHKIHEGSVRLDHLFHEYLPNLRRPVYAAIYIWVWINVAELSWDAQSIMQGFLGNITLSELLSSLPESGIGLIAASFGLGYGALPIILVARLVWLVANHYIKYVPGKGLQVHWKDMGVDSERDGELIPA